MIKKTTMQRKQDALMDRFYLRFGTWPEASFSVPGRLKLFGHDLHPQQPTLAMSIDARLTVFFTPSTDGMYGLMMDGYPLVSLPSHRIEILPQELGTPIGLLKRTLQTVKASRLSHHQGLKIYVHSELPPFGNVGYSTAFIIGMLAALIPSFFSLPFVEQVMWVHRIEQRLPQHRFHPHDAWMMLQPGFHHGYWVDGHMQTRMLPSTSMKNLSFFIMHLPFSSFQSPASWDIPSLLIDALSQEGIRDLHQIEGLWLAQHAQRLTDTYGKKTWDGLTFIEDEKKRVIQSMIRYEQEDWEGFYSLLFQREQQLLALHDEGTLPPSMIEKKKTVLATITPTLKWTRDVLSPYELYIGLGFNVEKVSIQKTLHRHFPHAHLHMVHLDEKKLKIRKR